MRKMDNAGMCIIVIPVYKEECTKAELASFRQCLTILKNYNICLITFKELNLSLYLNEAKNYGKSLIIKYFDKAYFTSVAGYNTLCKEKEFYKVFLDYKYLLIYQLDAWVFNDDLKYWCDLDYDYIGAPWFVNDGDNSYKKEFFGVGNGGFSLRKTKYCYDLLNGNKKKRFFKFNFLWSKTYGGECYKHKNRVIAYFTTCFMVLIKLITGKGNSLGWILAHPERNNEDLLFSLWASHSRIMKKVSIPGPVEAASFAIEVNPSYLVSLTGRLPFGCHAFEKWEFDSFWRKYIKID